MERIRAHDRGLALVVAVVQGLGSARQKNRQWAQVAVKAQGSGH